MGKGYFFLLTTLPGRGWNMVGTKKWGFFFGPKNPDFGPKIRFFVWDRVFGKMALVTLGVGSVLAPSDLFLSISNEAFLQYFVTLWQDSPFKHLFRITSLQHPLRTSGCFQTLNSYLKEFLEDPQSFPVDRVIQGGLNIYPSKYFTLQVPPSAWLHLHLDLLPPSSSDSFRSLNFSNIFQDHQERLVFQHLEMTSLWRKFHVWAASGHVLCDLRCVI